MDDAELLLVKESKTRLCHYEHCRKPLRGRIDKKFCNDQCRNNYNNPLKRKHAEVRKINNILVRNYQVLDRLFKQNRQPVKIKLARLLENKFIPQHCTGISVDENSEITYYCYHFFYRVKDDVYHINRLAPVD